MDTLLTEIISFIRNCEGDSGLRGGTAAAGFILTCLKILTADLRGCSRIGILAANKRESEAGTCRKQFRFCFGFLRASVVRFCFCNYNNAATLRSRFDPIPRALYS